MIGNFTNEEVRFELPSGLWRKGINLLDPELRDVTLGPEIALTPYASHAVLVSDLTEESARDEYANAL